MIARISADIAASSKRTLKLFADRAAAMTAICASATRSSPVAQRAVAIDPDNPDWRTAINDGVFGVFRDDLLQPDERDPLTGRTSQVGSESGPGITGKDITADVEPLNRRQVAGSPQPRQVSTIHNPIPLHLTKGQDARE
jgi:hypothetical protein